VCKYFITYDSHHKSRAQGGRIPPAPQAPASGLKTRRGIEGEEYPAAAGIRRSFSLSKQYLYISRLTWPVSVAVVAAVDRLERLEILDFEVIRINQQEDCIFFYRYRLWTGWSDSRCSIFEVH